jgi:hypothetical protein
MPAVPPDEEPPDDEPPDEEPPEDVPPDDEPPDEEPPEDVPPDDELLDDELLDDEPLDDELLDDELLDDEPPDDELLNDEPIEDSVPDEESTELALPQAASSTNMLVAAVPDNTLRHGMAGASIETVRAKFPAVRRVDGLIFRIAPVSFGQYRRQCWRTLHLAR